MTSSRSPQLIGWTALAAVVAVVATAAAQARPNPPDPPGPPTTQAVVHCVVPTVRGLRLGVAKAKVVEANCAVGRISRRHSKVAKGRVVSASPRAGSVLASGWQIRLVVSRGRR